MSCTTTQTSISRRSTELAARRRLRHAQSVNPGQQSQWRFADRLASPELEIRMTFMVDRLATSWLTRKDLDYHMIRASMVIIFLFFGYPEMVRVRSAGIDPVYRQRPADFLVASGFRNPRRHLVFSPLRTECLHLVSRFIRRQELWCVR